MQQDFQFIQLGDTRMESVLRQLLQEAAQLPVAQPEHVANGARIFVDDFIARMAFFNQYACSVYGTRARGWASLVGGRCKGIRSRGLGNENLADLYLDR